MVKMRPLPQTLLARDETKERDERSKRSPGQIWGRRCSGDAVEVVLVCGGLLLATLATTMMKLSCACLSCDSSSRDLHVEGALRNNVSESRDVPVLFMRRQQSLSASTTPAGIRSGLCNDCHSQ